MPDARFTYSLDTLREMVADVLRLAREQGATEAEADVSEGYGQTVTVRRNEVETIEYNRDKGLGVSVYIGKQRGYASSSDLAPRAIRDTVAAALSIARFTAADDAAGLADPALISRSSRDLDLFHPWDLPVEQAIAMAKSCEAAAFRLDPRIVNSEGASVSTQQSQFIAGNTAGFLDGFASSRHYISCAVIAAEGDAMQRDDWYSSQRAASRPRDAGSDRGLRRPARARPPAQPQARQAQGPRTVRGAGRQRPARALRLGRERRQPLPQELVPRRQPRDAGVLALVNLREEPHLPRGQASACFDDDGVASAPRDVVKDGVVQGYFLGVYSARKLGMQTTGNAGGNYNLILAPGERDFVGMLKALGTGLLVTELMGQGVNQVTGDYSRGASGYWVERGEIRYPVEEITVAANLRDMFRNIAAVGGDVLTRGSRTCGSILVEGMTIGGS